MAKAAAENEKEDKAEAMEGLREAFETILGAVANNGGNSPPNNKPPLLSIERCIVVFCGRRGIVAGLFGEPEEGCGAELLRGCRTLVHPSFPADAGA